MGNGKTMRRECLEIDHVDVEGRILPIGLDSKTPVFHYTVKSHEKGKTVTAHRIVVKCGGTVHWDSGKTPSGEYPYVTYAGPPLRPKTVYEVSVRVWDEQDNESNPSRSECFETGLLYEGFQADWLEPVQEDAIEEEELPFFQVFRPNPDFHGNHVRCRPAQNLRKSFLLDTEVKRARVYASAHGIYELYINGEKAGDACLSPEISTYQEYLYYQTYDITDLLTEGENVVAATVADGWWIGRIGLVGMSCQYGNRLGFIMQMEIETTSGETLVVLSDEGFRCHESEVRYADLYMGEKRDNTIEQIGWQRPGFDASGWASCQTAAFSKDNLIGQPIDSITKTHHLIPERWMTTPKGECVVDFGQVLSGTIELTLAGMAGQVITAEYCEVLDKDGNYFRNITGRNKDQTDVLVCRDGMQTWRPTFTYHGFRYVKLTGATKDQVADLKAIILSTRLRTSGLFSCSDERLTQLQQSIVWSERGNMMSIPTDCPQRERMGWTGDIQIFAKTGAFNSNLKSFLEVWLMNLRAEQGEDGSIPVIAPLFPKQEQMIRQIGGGDVTSSGWSDACILLPWYLYQCYGDISVLRDNYSCMKRHLEFVKKQAAAIPESYSKMTEKQKRRNRYLWNKGYHYGDWLIPSLLKTPNGIAEGRSQTREIVGSSWYAITMQVYLEICKALQQAGWHLDDELADKERLLKNIQQAIREEYVAKDGTILGPSLQGLYVMILRSGAVEGTLRKRVANQLVGLIHENGDCLDTGFSSVGFLLDMLTETGHKDVAYALLNQKKSPSWLYMIENGATTIWESWSAIDTDGNPTTYSYNHYAYGCVGDWMYRNIGGIAPGKPGYKHIVFAPDFHCGLSSSSCSHTTPFGKALCEWQISDGECAINLEIPVSTTAELRVDGTVMKLVSGRHSFVFECNLSV